MNYQREEPRLLKFLVTSAACFFVGTVHGVIQIIHPVRVWLDSIGSPYGGPGHMIDPLAHAHMNLIGGVVLLVMATTYYLFPRITNKALYSYKLVEHSFWWTTLGLIAFYSTFMFFGIYEGMLMLDDTSRSTQEQFHATYYPITITIVANAMGMGFWIFFFNVFMTYRKVRQK